MRLAPRSAPLAFLFLALLPGCPGCGDDGGASAPNGAAGKGTTAAGGSSAAGTSAAGGKAGTSGASGKGGSAGSGGTASGGAGKGGSGLGGAGGKAGSGAGGSGPGGTSGAAGKGGGAGGSTAGSGGVSAGGSNAAGTSAGGNNAGGSAGAAGGAAGASAGKGGSGGSVAGAGGTVGGGGKNAGGSGANAGSGGAPAGGSAGASAGGASAGGGLGGSGGTSAGPATGVFAGTYTSCALFQSGEVRCWGSSDLTGGVWNGLGGTISSEQAKAVPLSGLATALSFGDGTVQTCAIRADGALLCWGSPAPGQLVGDSAPPPVVPFAGNPKISQIAISTYHACAVTDQGAVRCWGDPGSGKLGYGNLAPVTSDQAGDVDVGGPALQVSIGLAHSCALLTSGAVRCWGSGYSHGVPFTNVFDIGDDEVPSAYAPIDFGGTVQQIATGNNTTCALLTTGDVKCWGETASPEALGVGAPFTPDFSVSWLTPALDLGGKATRIAGGGQHYCAILEGGGLRCWGDGMFGQLGYGNVEPIGDNETPASAGDVPVGGAVTAVALGVATTCAVVQGGGVRCWGSNTYGMCGRDPAVDSSIGDDETPASLGDLVFP